MEDITRLTYPLCGVYVLWEDEICIYVGASANVLARLPQHKARRQHNSRFQWNRVTFIECSSGELVQREFMAIREFQPRFNKQNQGKPLTKRIDLVALGLKPR